MGFRVWHTGCKVYMGLGFGAEGLRVNEGSLGRGCRGHTGAMWGISGSV